MGWHRPTSQTKRGLSVAAQSLMTCTSISGANDSWTADNEEFTTVPISEPLGGIRSQSHVTASRQTKCYLKPGNITVEKKV